MLSTHCVVALPAYDMNANILDPSAYQLDLPGALVQVSFMMHHWVIKTKKRFLATISQFKFYNKQCVISHLIDGVNCQTNQGACLQP
jgi:hypothetical protein